MTNEEINEIVNDWVTSAEKLKLCPHSKIVDSLTIGAAEDVFKLANKITTLLCQINNLEHALNIKNHSVLGAK